jgi:hypothetical protein
MKADKLFEQMADTAERIAALARGFPKEHAATRTEPDSWSLVEVLAHLSDEEREDFRPRLDIALHHPERSWPRIDPEGWVLERSYGRRDPERELAAFLSERAASLEWLRGLASPDWEAVYSAPWGPIRAGDLLAAWAMHDVLHLRQIVELLRDLVDGYSGDYSARYAGPW